MAQAAGRRPYECTSIVAMLWRRAIMMTTKHVCQQCNQLQVSQTDDDHRVGRGLMAGGSIWRRPLTKVRPALGADYLYPRHEGDAVVNDLHRDSECSGAPTFQGAMHRSDGRGSAA